MATPRGMQTWIPAVRLQRRHTRLPCPTATETDGPDGTMDRVEIKTSLTLADWRAYQAQWAQRIFHGRPTQLVGFLLGAGIIVAAAVLADYLGKPLSMLSLLAGILFVSVGSFYSAQHAKRSSVPDPDGHVLGPCSIEISTAGIDVAKTGAAARYDWSIVRDLEWTNEHLFVWLDRVAALIVPLRDLPEGLDVAQFRETIEALRNGQRQSTSEAAFLPPEAPQATQGPASQESRPLPRFMRAYGALLLGRKPDANDLTTPTRFLLLFPLVGIALWLAADRWSAGADATFYPPAVLTWSWYAVILLVAVWAASRLSQPRVPYERVLVLTAAFLPVFVLLDIAREQWVVRHDWAFFVSLAIVFYAAFYVSRTLWSLTGTRQSRAARAFAVILFVGVWATNALWFSGSFWYAEEADEDSSDYWTQMKRSEALMYAQPKRIDAAVAALQRPADLPAAAFFVGFAGQGEQHVFASEISLARKVFAEKFGSAQRSVLLVNDQRDLETLPLATPTALRYALNGIAARMRLDSDVLFLSLSSHGSSDGAIMVSNGMHTMNDLSVDDLAAALRESRIKWRVIVVSACYAGKFIAPLRDENTIIIAAAAADRTSFGCSDDRDLTYFGEAFYRDSIPAATDLQTAFQKASAEIAEREKKEKKTASNPQAYFGRALVEHLKASFPRS